MEASKVPVINKGPDASFGMKNQESNGEEDEHDQTELKKDPKWWKTDKLQKDRIAHEKQLKILREAKSMDDRGKDKSDTVTDEDQQ